MPIELVPTIAKFFPATENAFREPPISHRSDDFSAVFRVARERLRLISGDRYDSVFFCGSGTFANELMVWTFAPPAKKILVLSNGEFGERLAKQVSACRSDALVLDFGFGNPMNESVLRKFLEENPGVDLIFGVACETSWGGTTNLEMLSRVARERGIEICLDAMSAFAFSPEIFMFPNIVAVSASSGKALAALPGIAMLFFEKNREIPEARRPKTLDLKSYIAAAEKNAPRNTLSSVLLKTFHAALGEVLSLGCKNYRNRLLEVKRLLLCRAESFGAFPLPDSDSPMITAFPRNTATEKFLDDLREHGFVAYTQPDYLSKRGIFEIAVMGNFSSEDFLYY